MIKARSIFTAAMLACAMPFAVPAAAQPAPELVFALPMKDGMETEPVSQVQLTFNTDVIVSHVDVETPDGTKLVLFDVVANNGEGQTGMVFSYDLPVPIVVPGQYFINYVAEVNRSDGTMDTVSAFSSFTILEP
ncbi:MULTISPECIES: copper resistance protein CopC [Sphingomonadales]|jgi:hypothetical protein|uniref:copper resistance protein CopC n=1 Tax=Sphingomonadales TaxID=204457 RepID=UPI000826C444|nr:MULTISPECIES: copper resistance protein CopC [Sphingomonadales]MAF62468.1 hypothetical protein [Blastomonas sp.]|tara:strand:- start:211120 stop:211521 length:402 start_codon:yes stop_codon:yes gene_type:complete